MSSCLCTRLRISANGGVRYTKYILNFIIANGLISAFCSHIYCVSLLLHIIHILIYVSYEFRLPRNAEYYQLIEVDRAHFRSGSVVLAKMFEKAFLHLVTPSNVQRRHWHLSIKRNRGDRTSDQPTLLKRFGQCLAFQSRCAASE